MKKFVVVAVLLLISVSSAISDEAPSWQPYEVCSSDGHYIAKVTVTDKAGKQNESEWKYDLSVFRKDNIRDTTLLWSCEYQYDGYEMGMLSDDGTTFAYVNEWYYERLPIVRIYQNGKLKKQITGNEFNLDTSDLLETVSHHIWISPDFRYGLREEDNNLFLEINTRGAKRFLIDLRSFEIIRKR